MLFFKIKKNVSEKLVTVSFFTNNCFKNYADLLFMKLSLKYTCSNYYKNILQVERGRGLLELSLCIFLNPSTVIYCKIPAYSVPMHCAWSCL